MERTQSTEKWKLRICFPLSLERTLSHNVGFPAPFLFMSCKKKSKSHKNLECILSLLIQYFSKYIDILMKMFYF